MRHLITEPQDAYTCEPTQADWDDYRDYLDSLERVYIEQEFDEANRELAAIESPV